MTDKDLPETFFIFWAYQIHNLDIFGTTSRIFFFRSILFKDNSETGGLSSTLRKSAIDHGRQLTFVFMSARTTSGTSSSICRSIGGGSKTIFFFLVLNRP